MKYLPIITILLVVAACSRPDAGDDAQSDLTRQCDSLVGKFNQFQAECDPMGAVAWLEGLMQNPPKGLRHDVEVIYAYALSRVDSLESAEAHMTHALSIPMENPDDQRLFRDYAYAAATFFPDIAHEDDVIDWAKNGLDCALRCGNPPGTDYLRAMLADIYKRKGRVVEAIALLNDALTQSRERGDTTAIVSALNSLAQLYAEWGLPSEADIYATEGAVLTLAGGVKHPIIATEALTVKAHCAVELDQEEAGRYLASADSLAVNLPYNMGQEDIDLIFARYQGGQEAVERIKRFVTQASPYKAVDGWLALAMLYKSAGDRVNESVALDSLCSKIGMLSNKVRISSGTWNFAIGECALLGNSGQLATLGRLLAADTLGTVDDYTRQCLWENVLREQALTHDMEMKAVSAEKSLHTTRMWLAIVAAILAIVVCFVLIWWLRKRYQRRQEELSSQLMEAMRNADEERRRAENMIVEPESLGMIRQLTPSLLIEKGEMEFREQFMRLYPRFLISLPKLSHRDELLCMLIALEVDAHRCAQLLAITKASVNTARYRLRRKLNLPTDLSLDDYIREHLY
ncbi:MAG: tetratricopeptide repeat protein [Bacteroidales bacterium]|nr:tetratricopeptide repeat protein [Bacteroidales bacterium]MCD8394919.1 tetratricopeptide repeat protein [Bacteroidales bacterium]